MAKYYGYRKCSHCEIECTPGNYLDYSGKRFCTACWIQHENPDHPGREHHNLCFSSWMAGGGIKGGIVHGESDEYGIRTAKDAVHTHDLHATMLHLLGINHEQLTFRHAGRDFRLTDVYGNVINKIIS